eukprot:TRINITY_DN22714_c0_g2_i2.p1 TRINITY_DN22714_c0_g2~~TRINITY_DN22714_c0_g2_i2.p1  ORF type:complete len:395 (+),score=55.08 TRINITY_DN22714_c0_g2_i2:190-1374(+)
MILRQWATTQICGLLASLGSLVSLLKIVHGAAGLDSVGELSRLRHYGFITRLDVSAEEARGSIDQLYSNFGIVDFQFYDAFFSYSIPCAAANGCATSSEKFACKPSACFTNHVRMLSTDTIRAYTDAIARIKDRPDFTHRQPARSWLYVQAVAADEPSSELGSQYVPYRNADGSQIAWTPDKKCLYTYHLTEAWADRMVDLWAPYAVALGFDGIHWDQLGSISDDDAQNARMGREIATFLRRAGQRLSKEHGLLQTFNFVNGFGWDDSLYTLAGESVVQFPYWEVWDDSKECDFWKLFNFSAAPRPPQPTADAAHAVFARYPDPGCCDNDPSAKADDIMLHRWQQATSACATYLVLGDGDRRLNREYFPSNSILTNVVKSTMMNASIAKVPGPC